MTLTRKKFVQWLREQKPGRSPRFSRAGVYCNRDFDLVRGKYFNPMLDKSTDKQLDAIVRELHCCVDAGEKYSRNGLIDVSVKSLQAILDALEAKREELEAARAVINVADTWCITSKQPPAESRRRRFRLKVG